jgi:hypothetical protein
MHACKRCMPVRFMPCEMHACEMHAYEMLAHEMHAHEIHACQMLSGILELFPGSIFAVPRNAETVPGNTPGPWYVLGSWPSSTLKARPSLTCSDPNTIPPLASTHSVWLLFLSASYLASCQTPARNIFQANFPRTEYCSGRRARARI